MKRDDIGSCHMAVSVNWGSLEKESYRALCMGLGLELYKAGLELISS